MSGMQRYETQVDMRSASGEPFTVAGDGVGPAGVSGEQLLNGAEAAARELYPSATVEAVRARPAR